MKHLEFEITIGDIGNFAEKIRSQIAALGGEPHNGNVLFNLIEMFRTYAESKVKDGQEYEADFGESKIAGSLLHISGKKGEKNFGFEFDKEFTTIGFSLDDLLAFTIAMSERNNAA